MPYRPPKKPALKEPASRVPQHYNAYPSSIGIDPKQLPPTTRRRARRQGTIRSLDMRVAYVLSFLAHLLSPVALVMLTILVLLLMGIDPEDWFHHVEPKPPDLEFVLVPPDQAEVPPINKETNLRAAKNSRAGGENDPNRRVSPPETADLSKPAVAEEPLPPQVKPQPQAEPQPPQPQKPPEVVKPPTPPKKELAKAITAPIPRHKPVISAPQPLTKTIANTMPVPSTTTGPIVKNNTVSMSTSSLQPIPFMDSSAPSNASSATSAKSSGALGSLANASPGNKSAAFGVDALKEPDFGPYMKDLQQRIKQSWRPPRGNESKRVVVVFRVDQQGKLEDIRVSKSSGVVMADQAAIAAVQKIFPFRPLPEDYAEENIDIEFTFDYNVFGDKKRSANQYSDG
jgi:TonB family protein